MKFRPYIRYRHFKHHTGGVSYTPTKLAAFYGFPTSTTGTGKKIAVIELGGGFSQADLDTYFKSLGLKVKPVVFHGVDGGTNTSDGPDGADGEVMLDLCVAGGMAPGAELHCYTAPNTDQGFLDAIKQAIADKMDAISISWGAPEDQWNKTTIASFNAAFQAAAAAGIAVTVAAGDNGSSDGETGQHVDFPSSSPYVIACGGTSLPQLLAAAEVVWNDGTAGGATGGGVSADFPLPAWQAGVGVPGAKFRGVPDFALNADPDTGWLVMVDGQQMVIGGTSAVAPAAAALCVLIFAAAGKNIPNISQRLYGLPAGTYRDITQGNNGTYVAKAGWDACTGLGAPVGSKLLAVLAPAPTPTPTPPPPAPVPAPGTRTIVVAGASSIIIDGKTV